jgi:7-carboxy-7-deazaguanine synthase
VARNRWDNLEALGPRDEVKIVLADRGDYEWAKEQLARTDLAHRCTVILSTVFGRLAPRDLAGWLLADRLPVRLQLPLHKLLWGPDARGV